MPRTLKNMKRSQLDTDLIAVPAEAVSELSGGGALLVHQQQAGKQPLKLQGNHSDLRGHTTKLLIPRY